MKRFRFALEAVQKQRERAEQAALRTLAEARRKLSSDQEHKNALISAMKSSFERREALAAASSEVSLLQVEDVFIVGSRVRITQADHAIQRAQKAVEKAQRAYFAARRKLQSILKLREKAQAEYKRERQRYELKQLDDLYVMRSQQENFLSSLEESA